MQRFKSPKFVAALIAVGALGLSGCATKKFVNEQVSLSDSRTQTRLDQQQAQLSQLDKTAQDALKRATDAGKLAEGKFLYSMVLSDDSIKFPLDSSKLSPEAEQRLSVFVDKLKSENRNIYLEIQGHTDATGADTTNQRLGEQRAEAVRVFMNRHGVPLNRMATISYGEKDPVADNKTRAGRSENRRVVLIVMS
ncbi:MAG: OmpA family protein [Rhodospirillaceae bacterium]|nr:OmpA family protein [Rhodospirillaceae bacterium]